MSFIQKIIIEINDFERKITELETRFLDNQFPNVQHEVSPLIFLTPVIYTVSNTSFSQIQEELFIQFVEISVVDIIKQLSYSLLSGEYISLDNIIDSLISIENTLNNYLPFLSNTYLLLSFVNKATIRWDKSLQFQLTIHL